MEIRPICSALLRHKTAALLIVLEIALSCAIICNAVFLIGARLQHMDRASGLAEQELVHIRASSIEPDGDQDAMRRTDLATLAAVPGVKSATSINQMPYGNNQWTSSVNLEPDQPDDTLEAAMYLDDGTLVETFGLHMVEGRDFESGEYVDLSALQAPEGVPNVPAAILTASLAARLFPDERALGKDIYVFGDAPSRIVGIVDRLLVPGTHRNLGSHEAMILPVRTAQGDYVLRTDPQRRDEVLNAAVDAMLRVAPNRIIDDQLVVTEMRNTFYSRDRAVVWLLLSVCIALLVVTALGIVGLASFWVQQRTRQIGVRRALGATRSQILRHFQMENFILAGIGIVLGMVLAFGINQLLMRQYELPRLPWQYLPAGAAILWVLGQVAVLGPARRAASVPPAIATRSA
jgi:putative ABC transport system permease protein